MHFQIITWRAKENFFSIAVLPMRIPARSGYFFNLRGLSPEPSGFFWRKKNSETEQTFADKILSYSFVRIKKE
jgi:hypothetical protein